MRTVFDDILLELADCAKTHNSIQSQRIECTIIDKYKTGLLTNYEYRTLYGVTHTLRKEVQ